MSERGNRPPSGPTRRLNVLRIGEGHVQQVIFVQGGPIMGLLTHHEKKRSDACQGEGCAQCRRNLDLCWKGYAAVLQWDKPGKQWWPAVLEVTESLELDLRGLVAHSSMWELSRKVSVGGRNFPVTGVQLPRGPAPLLCPTFDILPAVHWIYHDYAIVLNLASPLPPRVLVDPVSLPGPKEIGEKPPEKATDGKATVKFSERFKERSLTNGIGALPLKGGE